MPRTPSATDPSPATTPSRWGRWRPLRPGPRRRHHRSRRWPHPLSLALRVTVCAAGLLAAGPPASASVVAAAGDPGGAVSYIPPVDAPVSDPFRPPAQPFGPGNRGLEYATVPGTPVRASADGTVVFAGPVGGALHVTILHADGVRTSYSFLAAVDVVLGQPVHQGDRIGTAGSVFHFGARLGDSYIDPASLFAGVATTVVLLPYEVPPGSSPPAEARALAAITLGHGPRLPHLDLDLPSGTSALAWLEGTVRGGATGPGLAPLARGLDLVDDLGARLLATEPCSGGPPPVRPVAGQARVVVTVGGLGSTSDAAAVDDLRVDELGYRRDHLVRFSYAGGRIPGQAPAGALAAIPEQAYGSGDTQGDVDVAAGRLADLVEDVLVAEPGVTVDLYGHSLGGLVVRLALADLAGRGVDLGRIGLVATLGSPHRGAALATLVATGNERVLTGAALDLAAGGLDLGLDPRAPVVGQLAEGSVIVDRLGALGVPAGVDLVSIGARGDLVAPAPATEVAGGRTVIVPVSGPGAHRDLVSSGAATAELARALAGQPPGCEGRTDVVADVVVGHAIAGVEDGLGGLVAAGAP
jgi:hypothetical protein